MGNCLRVSFSASRSSETSGNITNEDVCTIEINHGGKIASIYNVSFSGGSSGGNSQFITTVSSSSEVATITVRLAAVAQSSSTFNAYFIVPVSLNLEAF